ncbi:hypothetical protein GLP59_15140 [Sulfitobacter sp. M220]|uniref:restriction endonuclease subunit S n=1 Tax=Sulfitobacter sp. M220 TaxID=2675333 RepID=UPI001F025AD9|nr:restriction endonuclease subunit S [Sulfitobacter sp. M220]MCF7778963.1 hypothetical protein [Sulfitobacter sp. M220]
MTQTQNAPKLRFPGFEGDWTRRKFDKIFKIRAGGDIDDSHTSKIKTEKFPFPIYANAKKNFGLYGYSDIYRVNEDCVTVAGRGVNIGYTVARCEPFYPIVRLLVLVPKSASDVHFFQSAIERTNIFVESTGVPQLTGPQLSSYQLAFPTLPEQRKIAGFLGAVDEKIAQLSRKKALLEDYKKGCMQQLFSQKIRFKDDDGNDFPDWEEKRLGELAKVTTGSSNRKDSDNVGEYAFFDRSNDVRWSSRYLFDCKAIIVAGEGKDFPPRFFNGKFDLHQRAYAVTDFGVNSARFLFFG